MRAAARALLAVLAILGCAAARRARGPVPRSCPTGGFPFAAAFTFADDSTAAATANLPWPLATPKR